MSGYGSRRIKMHFLPDVWVTCDNCEGTRYAETLSKSAIRADR